MTGDTPDDLEARKVANEKVVLEAIAASLADRISVPPHDARFPMPGTPSFDKSAHVAPPKDQRMSDTGNGQYQVFRAEVEGVKSQFHDFKEDFNGKLAGLSEEVKSVGKTVTDFVQAQSSRGGDNLVKIGGMILGVVGIAMTIATAFGSMANTQLSTNISFTNEKIARESNAADKSIAATNANISAVANTVHDLANSTIPRPELEYRINTNRDAIADIGKTISTQVVPRSEFEKRLDPLAEDLNSLKDDTLKRADLDGRFGDFQKRLDLISSRVEALQANNAGNAVVQEQVRQISMQVAELRTRALGVAHIDPHSAGN